MPKTEIYNNPGREANGPAKEWKERRSGCEKIIQIQARTVTKAETGELPGALGPSRPQRKRA